jgi:hypothetical protein
MARLSHGFISPFAAGVSLALLVTPEAHAQNTDSFLFSDEAALNAGAMCAVPGDAGGIWYNPASLGALKRGRVNVNGSVFGARVRPIDDALALRFGGVRSGLDLPGTDFVSTPTAVTASFAVLPFMTLGGGLFTTARDVRAGSVQDRVESASGETLKQRLSLIEDRKKLRAGGAYGFDAGYGLRVGGGMFGVLTTAEGSADYAVGYRASADAQEQVVAFTERVSQKVWGLQATAGLQYDPSPSVHLGVTVRLPEILLSASSSFNGSVIVASAESDGLALDEGDDSVQGTEWVDPAHLVVGVALTLTDRVRLSADVDLALGIDSVRLRGPRRPVVNGRAGVIVAVLPDTLDLGTGVLIDLPTDRALGEGLGATRLTYVGGTLGGTLKNTLRVGDDPKPDGIVLTTTIALRYVAGIGQARQLSVGDAGTTLDVTQTVTHDIMPYTGTAVLF